MQDSMLQSSMVYTFGLQNEESNSKKYFIELGPGQTRWVTEDEKWALKRVCTYPNAFIASLLPTVGR